MVSRPFLLQHMTTTALKITAASDEHQVHKKSACRRGSCIEVKYLNPTHHHLLRLQQCHPVAWPHAADSRVAVDLRPGKTQLISKNTPPKKAQKKTSSAEEDLAKAREATEQMNSVFMVI